MNKTIKDIMILIKNIFLLIIGIFFLLGAVIMINVDITATIFFGVISIICLFFSRNLLINSIQKNKIKDLEKIHKLKQIEMENQLRQKQQELEYEYKIKQIKIEHESRMAKKQQELESLGKNNNKIDSENYKLVEPSDYQYKININKIESLYNELGFNAKVIDIVKNKYCTEYEVIFPYETDIYKVMSVSRIIKDEFDIDGVNIKRLKKKVNHIYMCVPLEYKKVKNTYNA